MRYISEKKESAIILSKLQPHKESCLYLYCNLYKYGISNPHFKVYYDNQSEIVVGQYYGDSIHIMAQDYITEGVSDFVLGARPRTIFSSIKLPWLEGYDEETTGVYKLVDALSDERAIDHLRVLDKSEMEKLTDFLYLHSAEYRKSYDKTNLYCQLTERLESGYCRYFGLYYEDFLIGCAFTKAEIEDTMIVGGILVSPEFRGRGYGKMLCMYKAAIATSENKDAFCFIDDGNPASIELHSACGYKRVTTVFKYTAKIQ